MDGSLYISVDTYLLSMCSLLLLYPNNPVVSSIYTWSLCAYLSCYIPIILWFPTYTASVSPTWSLCAVYSWYIPIILWFPIYIYCICRYLLALSVYSCYIPIILWFPLYILYLSTPTWSLCAVYSCYIPIILWFPIYIYIYLYICAVYSCYIPIISVVSSIYLSILTCISTRGFTYLISMCSLLLLYPNNPVVPYIYCICRHLLALYVQSTPVISQ